MIPLDDPKWKDLKGAYGIPYDPSPDLLRLERGEDVWDTLWEELHHQGDVGEASYAAVPHLVRIAKGARSRDWNFYGLISTIEIERHRKSNPSLPKWLAEGYKVAWNELLALALDDLLRVSDPLTVQSILGAVALAKGALKLGAMLSYSDQSEIEDLLEERDAWSKRYQ
ncbi:MAG: hypothetical protein ABSG53_20645 [Thermoguttaceae bacterium]|jgi:hypothetical protein